MATFSRSMSMVARKVTRTAIDAPPPGQHRGSNDEQGALGPYRTGQHVFYPAHGTGEIVARETHEIAGEDIDLLVIKLPADQMTLRVPVAKAASIGIRVLPASTESVSGAPPLVPAPRGQTALFNNLLQAGFSEEELYELVIPKRTLGRRRASDELLTVEETDKAMRLMRIVRQAQRVFGEPGKAHRWLRKPKHALNGETPVAFLASEEGARTVEEMLHRIDHGMAA
jgi:putative toxin-antitoxin system antitoxin component (TIGR02293 family)